MSGIHWHVVATREDGTGTFVGPNFVTLQDAEAGATAYAAAMEEDGWTATPSPYGLALAREGHSAELGYTSCADPDCTWR